MAIQLPSGQAQVYINGELVKGLTVEGLKFSEARFEDVQPPLRESIVDFRGASFSASFEISAKDAERLFGMFRKPAGDRPTYRRGEVTNRLRKFAWKNGQLVEKRCRGRTGHRSLREAILDALQYAPWFVVRDYRREFASVMHRMEALAVEASRHLIENPFR